jgi:hypothetical protein
MAGFVAGAALLLINVRGSGPSRGFVSHGEARLWFILLAGQAGFWAVVTSYVWKIAWYYVRRSGRDLGRIALSIAVIFVLLIGVPIAVRLFEGPIDPIWGAAWKIPLLTGAGFVLVVLPSLMGVLGIQAFSVRSLGSTIEESDIDGFIELRDDLNRFLALLGAAIGLAVLSTGALRNPVLVYHPKAHLPPESILEYGGFLTLLLVFAYAPAYHALLRLGRRIRDVLLPKRPAPTDPGFSDWYATRRNLAELMQLEVGIYQRLQTAILILSPLVSAALSLAIPKRVRLVWSEGGQALSVCWPWAVPG